MTAQQLKKKKEKCRKNDWIDIDAKICKDWRYGPQFYMLHPVISSQNNVLKR